ncbi:uncharacterized protein LOC122503980 [Leptopilina heterotoma]|uniref:uncharacterized protein LOC122503980 n=1 Tax=Leptopilina heterotoma TaxID=63436 RepID=UPI001CA9F247|nr:uncharacterized protein LOC122503980 [Leptopilina heterotoma]XP_043470727.1 uncharacterized protein LOC122503980 [Leptopilina heterotoma]
METFTFATPMDTIQMISVYTYVTRIGRYLGAINQLVGPRLSQFAILNSFNAFFWEDEETHYDDRMDLIRKIIAGSDLYGEYSYENLDPDYISLMFDYIVYSTVFKKFGNIYGFLGEIVRSSNTLNINTILNKAHGTLKNLTLNNNDKVELDDDLFLKIFNGTLLPLFPKTKKYLTLDSVNFIYAQAGWTLYNNPDIIMEKRSYFFNLNSITKDIASGDDYVFDDCVEIGVAIEQLVIEGDVEKEALQIFALPAFLLYVHHSKEELKNLNMKDIVNSREHWKKAYDQLFDHLRNRIVGVQQALDIDPNFQYYLAAFDFYDRRALAGKEIVINCGSKYVERLEVEVDIFMNNSANYTCFNNAGEERLLFDLDKVYYQKFSEFLIKYYRHVKDVQFSEVNDSLEEKWRNNTDDATNNDFLNNDDSLYNSEDILNKNDSLSVDKNITRDFSLMSMKVNGKIFTFCNKSSSTIFNSNFLNTFPLTREKLVNFEKLYTEARGKRKHCLSSFLPCLAGLIQGNPQSSSNNCPVNGTFIFQKLQIPFILHQFITPSTRTLLNQFGITLRTFALKRSMLTALLKEKFLWQQPESMKFVRNLTISIPRFPVIDRGFDIVNSMNVRGLEAMNDLLHKIETHFFISYESLSRNFTVKTQIVNRTADEVSVVNNFKVYLKRFYGKPSTYYGFRFILTYGNKLAELRTVGTKQAFVQLVNVTEENRDVYQKFNTTNRELYGNLFYHTREGTLNRKKN